MTEQVQVDIPNSREAQFLAAQQARLDKVRTNAEQITSIHNNDNSQQQRKDFWILLKNVCSSLNVRLCALMGEIEEEKGDDERQLEDNNDMSNVKKPNKTDPLYVTAQQRNEALDKLQEVQLIVRCLGHYTLHSSKFTPDKEQYLPEELVQFTMPELPAADLRLLTIEFQKLKSKAQQAQDIIIPKEKFRFRRYRAALQKKKDEQMGGVGLGDEEQGKDVDEDLSPSVKDTTEDDSEIKLPAHQFDGVTLFDQKNCSIKVQKDGQFTILNDAEKTPSSNNPEDRNQAPAEAKAFLIRNLDSCHVIVDGLYSSLHIIDTKNTTIQINTPIAGPTHVTNCHDANINLSFCRQLRIHDCTNVTFYIHVASGPIIEGCKGMKFYQCDYVSNGNDEFEKEQNLYWDVKDFHWLKNLVKSPNFAVFSEEEGKKQAALQEMSRKTVDGENRNDFQSATCASVRDDEDDSSDEDEL